MLSWSVPGVGRYSRKLNVTQHQRADIRRSPVDIGAVGGWSGQIRNLQDVSARAWRDCRAQRACMSRISLGPAGAGSPSCRRCPALLRSRSMRTGAERRHACGQCAGIVGRHLRRSLPETAVQGSLPDRRARAWSSGSTADAPRQTHGAGSSPPPYRVASLAPTVPYQRPPHRRSDHAGQPEILGLSLFRQQSAHRRAVPEHLQGRAPRPPQLRRPGLLAGRDLQRQPRADACPGEFRHPQTRRHRRVLPRQRRDAGARRARPAAACRNRFRIPASMPCCWRRSLRSMPPIPAPANSGSRAGSSASSTKSADHLAELYGDPGAAKAFANMPVVIVGYSGGFVPTAWSLEVGGLGNRVRGVFLLDAVYGELDKFASWIENNRSGFFVSSYTRYTAAARSRADADAAGKGHRRYRRIWTARCVPAAWCSSRPPMA